jgi:ribosome-binding protein aMBF1 (putative translation factor)
MFKKDEMTLKELYALREEYQRMIGIAREMNALSQEFRLLDMLEELDKYIEERVGVGQW